MKKHLYTIILIATLPVISCKKYLNTTPSDFLAPVNYYTTQAQLNGPFDLAFDTAGNLYIVDTYNDRVRKVGEDGTINTVAGTGQLAFSGDNGKVSKLHAAPGDSLAVDQAILEFE